jgi:hypothetical protein
MPWPKLSETLPGTRSPDRCQSCGGAGPVLARWRECDDHDHPTPTVVVLCDGCGDALIQTHPRAYSLLSPNEPAPGAMPLCLDCRHRRGTACGHPDAKANGGTGVLLTLPRPTTGLVCSRGRKKKGHGGCCRQVTFWRGPVTACRQKDFSTSAGSAGPCTASSP